MRNILVQADNSPAMAMRLQAALAIGRRHRSHIELKISTPFQHYVASDPFGGIYLATEQFAQAQFADAELEEQLTRKMEREDVPWDISLADGDNLTALTIGATLADLVIVSLGQIEGQGSNGSATLAGDLALSVPAPVLAVPQTGPAIDLDAPVMIAWNGSPQAAHALRSAVPLIGSAASVTLVQVGPERGQISSDAALRYLSRHDVHAELREEPIAAQTAEETLERVSRDIGAGLIVMGAYGHSRLREMLFGGVTRYLLDAGHTPLLLAH